MEPGEQDEGRRKILIRLGAIALILVIFGVPAVLIPVTMRNVPVRSETKSVTTYQLSINTVSGYFRKHENADGKRRLMALPHDSINWIQLINPMGRKAPGGGYAILEKASSKTGAIGLVGDQHSVTITLPAYRSLEKEETILVYGAATSSATAARNE